MQIHHTPQRKVKVNVAKAIEDLTGMKKPEQDKIFQEVKANSAKLKSCPRHDFSICLDRYTKIPIDNPTPAQHFGARWGCKNCGGHVDGIAKLWYNQGLADATPQPPQSNE
jgi:hypothetical protein